MRGSVSRTLTTFAALLALLVLTASPAGAADRFAAEADGRGFEVSLGGELSFSGGLTEVRGDDSPFVEARGEAITLAEGTQSQASTSNRGASDSDESCAATGFPDPLTELGEALSPCSAVEVALPRGLPQALAEAEGLSVDAGSAIVADLADTILAPLQEELEPALGEVEDQVLAPVREALLEACNELLAETPLGEALGEIPLDEASELLGPVAEQFPEDDPCAVLLRVTSDPPVIGPPDEILQQIRDIVEAALGDTVLLAISAGESGSDIETIPQAVVATTTSRGVVVEMPSLEFVGDLVDELLAQLIDDFLVSVEQILEPVEEVVVELPGGDQLLGALNELLTLDVLRDPDPLLQIAGGDTLATATFDRTSGELSGDGEASIVTITFNQALAALLQQDSNSISVGPGDSATIFEGTPLESTIGVASVREEEAEQDGLPGLRVISSGVEVRLFEGAEQGPIELLVAESVAAAFGEGITEEQPVLPTTGANASLALLGAGLVLAATRLRRSA